MKKIAEVATSDKKNNLHTIKLCKDEDSDIHGFIGNKKFLEIKNTWNGATIKFDRNLLIKKGFRLIGQI